MAAKDAAIFQLQSQKDAFKQKLTQCKDQLRLLKSSDRETHVHKLCQALQRATHLEAQLKRSAQKLERAEQQVHEVKAKYVLQTKQLEAEIKQHELLKQETGSSHIDSLLSQMQQ